MTAAPFPERAWWGGVPADRRDFIVKAYAAACDDAPALPLDAPDALQVWRDRAICRALERIYGPSYDARDGSMVFREVDERARVAYHDLVSTPVDERVLDHPDWPWCWTDAAEAIFRRHKVSFLDPVSVEEFDVDGRHIVVICRAYTRVRQVGRDIVVTCGECSASAVLPARIEHERIHGKVCCLRDWWAEALPDGDVGRYCVALTECASRRERLGAAKGAVSR